MVVQELSVAFFPLRHLARGLIDSDLSTHPLNHDGHRVGAITLAVEAFQATTEGSPPSGLLRGWNAQKKETRCRLPQSWCDSEANNLFLTRATNITNCCSR